MALPLLYKQPTEGIDDIESRPVTQIGSNSRKGDTVMANRRNMMIWMKDLIDHMAHCHDQLQWASDDPTQAFLADSLIGDLNQCQRLCEQLRQSQKTRDHHGHFGSGDSQAAEVSYRGSFALS